MLTVRAGGGCLDIFSLVCHFFSFLTPSPLGEGPISTEILSQRAVKPNTTNQLKLKKNILSSRGGVSGDAMVLGIFQCQGVLLIWFRVVQMPIALSVDASWGCLDIFLSSIIFLSPSLWGTVRYRLKYCLKGPLSPKQPTNQSKFSEALDIFPAFYANCCIRFKSVMIM